MSHRIYFEYAMQCNVRSLALMAVKTCSKAVLALSLRHGKSPCFSDFAVLKVFGVDWEGLILTGVHGGFFLG